MEKMIKIDPIKILNDIAGDLYKCYEDKININEEEAKKALSMYECLERVYLEPIRRSKLQANTEKYTKVAEGLSGVTDNIQKAIDEIRRIVDTMERITEYAKIFDSVIKLAAGILSAI